MTAVVLCVLCLASCGESPQAAFHAGLEQFTAGRWSEAARTFSALAEGEGQLAIAARFNMGLALYHDGRFEPARAAFDSLRDAPDAGVRARAAFNSGNCAWRLTQKERAAENYREAIKLASAELAALRARRWRQSEIALLEELCRRASFNLRLAAAEEPDVRAAESPGSEAPEGGGESGAETAEAAESAPEASASSGAAGGALQPGSPERGDPLGRVLLRDSGPVLQRKAGAAAPGEPDW